MSERRWSILGESKSNPSSMQALSSSRSSSVTLLLRLRIRRPFWRSHASLRWESGDHEFCLYKEAAAGGACLSELGGCGGVNDMGSVVVGRGAANPHGGEGGELDGSVVVVGEMEMIEKMELWFLFCFS